MITEDDFEHQVAAMLSDASGLCLVSTSIPVSNSAERLA